MLMNVIMQIYMALYGLSILNRNNVRTYCANLDPSFQIFPMALLSSLSLLISITTEGFKLLNRANGSAFGGLALGLLKLIQGVNKEVSDETGETALCCRAKEVA